MMMAGRDTKTRFQGVYARHSIICPKSASKDARCRCTPSYFGVAYDPNKGSTRKTKHLPKATMARDARNDLIKLIASGKTAGSGLLTLQDVIDRFLEAAETGTALNKQGRPYRPKAMTGLRTDLNRIPDHLRSRRFDRVRAPDYQHVVDELLKEGLSGSRIQSVINSTRSMYRWAKKRGLAPENEALDVDLPATGGRRRERVATPTEMVGLIGHLELPDQAPFAIAAFAGLRAEEIRQLDWPDIDFNAGVLLVADGKSPAANRVVPIGQHLAGYLKREWMRQGRPVNGPVCPPRRLSNSGRLAMGQTLKRAYRIWKNAKLQPINLHECRHTCATWLDSAGVRPKVVSVWLGHSTPDRQPGAAPITQNTYTHLLDGDLEAACERLDGWLDDRLFTTRKETSR